MHANAGNLRFQSAELIAYRASRDLDSLDGRQRRRPTCTFTEWRLRKDCQSALRIAYSFRLSSLTLARRIVVSSHPAHGWCGGRCRFFRVEVEKLRCGASGDPVRGRTLKFYG